MAITANWVPLLAGRRDLNICCMRSMTRQMSQLGGGGLLNFFTSSAIYNDSDSSSNSCSSRGIPAPTRSSSKADSSSSNSALSSLLSNSACKPKPGSAPRSIPERSSIKLSVCTCSFGLLRPVVVVRMRGSRS